MRSHSSRTPLLRQTHLLCTALAVACMPAGLAAAPQTHHPLHVPGRHRTAPTLYTETLVPGPHGSLYGSTRVGTTGSAAVFQLSPARERRHTMGTTRCCKVLPATRTAAVRPG